MFLHISPLTLSAYKSCTFKYFSTTSDFFIYCHQLHISFLQQTKLLPAFHILSNILRANNTYIVWHERRFLHTSPYHLLLSMFSHTLSFHHQFMSRCLTRYLPDSFLDHFAVVGQLSTVPSTSSNSCLTYSITAVSCLLLFTCQRHPTDHHRGHQLIVFQVLSPTQNIACFYMPVCVPPLS